MLLLLTLRGTPFMYYGEEIGMRNIPVKRSEIMDPPGRKYWPLYKGRDVCRSPMQWDAAPNAGFTNGRPWLKVHSNYPKRNVAVQQGDPESLLNFTRRLIALRKGSPALVRGDYTPLETGSPKLMAYLRAAEGETVLVALNFSGRRIRAKGIAPTLQEHQWELMHSTARQDLPPMETWLELEPYEVCLLIAR
jgi:alpha-glucosidase